MRACSYRRVRHRSRARDTCADPLWGPAAESCPDAADRIRAAGGVARNLVLPDSGIHGNSHMLMLDENNKRITRVIIRRLEANVWKQK